MTLTDNVLGQTFREAMRLWDAQKADGVSRADRVLGLANTLRAAWPKGRDEGWKYLCSCSDYGVQLKDCPGDATCGRVKPHAPHDYVEACWCQAGARFRAAPKPSPEDFTAAGKSPTKPTRVGRF